MPSKKQRLQQLSGDWTASELSVSYKPGIKCETPINTPQGAYDFILSVWDMERIHIQEQFMAFFINCKGQIIGYRVISTGNTTSVPVDVRLIVSLALHTLATCVIVAHNHPSGKLEASKGDLESTKRLKKALKLIEVPLWDHLIITESGYFSMTTKGLV